LALKSRHSAQEAWPILFSTAVLYDFALPTWAAIKPATRNQLTRAWHSGLDDFLALVIRRFVRKGGVMAYHPLANDTGGSADDRRAATIAALQLADLASTWRMS
jgi:hypothetical protein